MYTGRLDVSIDNIYTVLVATHLLHMPGALEQCRAALLRLRVPPILPPPTTSSTSDNILRPVPSRLIAPSFCWPQHGLYPSPLDLPHLPTLQIPTILPTALTTKENNSPIG